MSAYICQLRLPGRIVYVVLSALLASSLAAAATAPGKPAGGESGQTGTGAQTLPKNVVMRINGIDVTRDRYIDELFLAVGESYRETYISHFLLDMKAAELGVAVSDAEIEESVNKTVDSVRQERFGDDAEKLKQALADQGVTIEGWKQRLKVDNRYDLLTEKLMKKERSITDEELKKVFEDRYGRGGAALTVRHIQKLVVVATAPDYTMQDYNKEKPKVEEAAQARAAEALQKLRSGESFESVMHVYSDDPKKTTGGVLPSWKGLYGEDFDKAASALKKDEISGVIKSADGFRIIQCTAVTPTEEIRAEHILISTGAHAKGRTNEQSEKKAREILDKIKAGGDFSALAKENSDDPASAQRGGDLGFFGKRAMVKPFEDAAFALEPGQLSDLVKTGFGYHIIKVLEKRTLEDRTIRQIWLSTLFAAEKGRRVRPALEAQIRSQLEAIAEELKKPGASFDDLAMKNSDDFSTRENGGLLRPYRDGVYGPDFDQAVKSMKAGDPPRILKDEAGNMHLVVSEGMVKTEYAAVKDKLKDEYVNKPIIRQEKAEYLKKLRSQATVLP